MKPHRTLLLALVIAPTLLQSCSKSLFVQSSNNQYYVVDPGIAADSGILAMLAPYKIGVDTQMQVVIGHTDIPLSKAQPESTLGNFMADAQLVAAQKIDHKVVASVMNYGGIRLPYLAPGKLTRGLIYELMPFDNMLTIVDVPGEVLKEFCTHMARARGWPVAGLTYEIKDKRAENIKVGGKPVNDHIIYKVAMSDYIAKGGDHCDFLVPLEKKYTTIFVRDALIEYVMNLERYGRPLHPEIENRVRYAE